MSLMPLHLGMKSTTGKSKMNATHLSFVLGVILLMSAFAFGDEITTSKMNVLCPMC